MQLHSGGNTGSTTNLTKSYVKNKVTHIRKSLLPKTWTLWPYGVREPDKEIEMEMAFAYYNIRPYLANQDLFPTAKIKKLSDV